MSKESEGHIIAQGLGGSRGADALFGLGGAGGYIEDGRMKYWD